MSNRFAEYIRSLLPKEPEPKYALHLVSRDTIDATPINSYFEGRRVVEGVYRPEPMLITERVDEAQP